MYADNVKCEIIKDMKELNITKAYYLGDLNTEQLSLFSNMLQLKHTSSSRKDIFKWLLYYQKHLLLCYKQEENFWYFSSELDLEIVNALTLFEPQFKQGDKVLYTDDLVNWEEGIFLVKHDESYIVESDEMLLYAIEIKPYEEEIKVGDWVVSELNDCVFKYQFGRVKGDLTKITDEVLINKLNEI